MERLGDIMVPRYGCSRRTYQIYDRSRPTYQIHDCSRPTHQICDCSAPSSVQAYMNESPADVFSISVQADIIAVYPAIHQLVIADKEAELAVGSGESLPCYIANSATRYIRVSQRAAQAYP